MVKYHRVSANASTKCHLLVPFAPTYVYLDQPSFLLVYVRALPQTDGEMMHLAAKAREKERRGLPINDWSMGQCIPVGTALIHNVIWFFIKQMCLADEVHSKVLSKFLDPSLALPRPGIPLIASPFKRRACRVKEAAVEALTENGIRPGPPPASPTTTD